MPPIYLAIAGLLAASVGGLGWILTEAKPWAWLIFFGTIVNVGGAFWAERRTTEREAEVDALQKESLRLSRQLEQYTRGTGSYCYFEPTVSSVRNGAIGGLIAVGESPVYDVRLRIVPDPHRRLRPVTGRANYDVLEEMIQVQRWLDVGTLNPSNMSGVRYPWRLEPFDLGESEQRRAYNVFFSARNDQFMQYLRFVRVGARWFVAYRVVRQLAGNEGPVLKQFVQEGYPLNAAGQVDWQWEPEEPT